MWGLEYGRISEGVGGMDRGRSRSRGRGINRVKGTISI